LLIKKTFIICFGIFYCASKIFAQQDNFADEELWYLRKEAWIVAAIVFSLLLLAFYLKFKPKKAKKEKPGPHRTSQSPAVQSQSASEDFNNKST
jgi:heme/copper-type cytochrome/quinol oxidase subunit 2